MVALHINTSRQHQGETEEEFKLKDNSGTGANRYKIREGPSLPEPPRSVAAGGVPS